MTQSDMGKTLGEIGKVDPHFTKEAFLTDLQFDIIPTILEVKYIIVSVVMLYTVCIFKGIFKGKIRDFTRLVS